MILVDSSVWINWLRDDPADRVARLESLDMLEILVADLVVTEVLQGARNDAEALYIERTFRAFGIRPICSPTIALKAAHNFRLLRTRGITIRKTIDLIIGTFCIENGHTLLHADRDFLPMAEHLGLQLA